MSLYEILTLIIAAAMLLVAILEHIDNRNDRP